MKNNKKTKIVVFGGSGFLGSHVVDALIKENYDVTVFDLVKNNWINKDIKQITGSILDFELLKKTIKNFQIIYNFSAISDIEESQKKPLETISVNITGNANILECCRLFNIKRYVFASTVYIGGNKGSFYKCSKQAAEEYIKEYNSLFKVNYSILRYGSLYGPRSNQNNDIYNIIYSALKNNTVEYRGYLDSRRNYIHVLDASKLSVKILGKDYKNKTLILSGNDSIKKIDLIKLIIETINKNIKIKYSHKKRLSHYIITPNMIENNEIIKKINLNEYVDLNEGIFRLINEINAKLK